MKYAIALLLVGLSVSPALSFVPGVGRPSLPASEPKASEPKASEPKLECQGQSCDDDAELEQARDYLVETARPGGTMTRQGSDLAIERLHPEFAKRLADAIRAARRSGLEEVGIFSAYRPPVFGVGGFGNKYYSLHAYGLAVDLYGVGRPGSREAKQWHEIAAGYGIVCPYGYRNRAEWNHCQATQLAAVKSEHPLRKTIAGSGPIDLERMFEVGNQFIANVKSAIATVVADRSVRPAKKVVAKRAVKAKSTRVSRGRKAANTRRAAQSSRVVKRSRSASRQSRSSRKSAQSTRTRAQSARARAQSARAKTKLTRVKAQSARAKTQSPRAKLALQ
jgi:hypothetical protein